MARLEIAHPVLIDSEFEVWQEYENKGWPARYLFDGRARLFEYHYGEGGYKETELAIQELLGVERDLLEPLRPEDADGAKLALQTPDCEGAWSGPYQAGGVWAVLTGTGTIAVNGASITIDRAGAYRLVEHDRHTAAVLELEIGEDVECLATCFTPGVA